MYSTNLNPRCDELELRNSRAPKRSINRSNRLSDSQQTYCLQLDEFLFDFTLSNPAGESIHLKDCITDQLVVLLIHEGQPLSKHEQELKAWEKALPIFTKLGIRVIEIVSSLQNSLFSSLSDTTLNVEVLIDAHHQIAQSFTLISSPAIAHPPSYQTITANRPMQLVCAIAGDQVFLAGSATADYIAPIDPMCYVMLLDPDYWLALV